MKRINKIDYNRYMLQQKTNAYKASEIEIPEYEYKQIMNKYELLYEEQFENNKFNSLFWNEVPEGPSMWNSTMGLHPIVLNTTADGKFIRLLARKVNTSFKTAGLKTPIAYGDGKFECEARFKSGKSSWPAIWITHPNGSLNNYENYFEVDISEYYETRDVTEVTYHCPSSMRGGGLLITPAKPTIKKDDWNKFECYWDEDCIIVCINGQQVMTIPNDGDPTHFPIDPEARTFTIILSMQYGSNPWLSDPDLSELPLQMDVRNIKYYKKVS